MEEYEVLEGSSSGEEGDSGDDSSSESEGEDDISVESYKEERGDAGVVPVARPPEQGAIIHFAVEVTSLRGEGSRGAALHVVNLGGGGKIAKTAAEVKKPVLPQAKGKFAGLAKSA